MKVKMPSTLAAIVMAAVVGTGVPATLEAQRPDPRVSRIMVPVFQGPEKTLRVQATDAVRNRLSRDINQKVLAVISKGDVAATLEASGYQPDEPLIPNDARMLANQLRADEYLEGTVTRSPAGVRLDARLLVPWDRETSYVQPLPVAEAVNMGQAAEILSKHIQEARRQIDAYKACNRNYKSGKYREAITAAQPGITLYSRSTLARLCVANSYYLGIRLKDSVTFTQYRMEDSVLALVNEIRAVDPRSIPALKYAATIYQARGDDDRAIEALLGLLAADPTNVTLQKEVVNDLAGRGKANLAVPIVREIITNNPADPGLLRTAWLVYLNASEWEDAVAIAADMIKADTSLADTTYFNRLGRAYTGLDRTQKAIETFTAGTTKFPNNASLWALQGIALRKAGQLPQAAAALRRAVSLNPKIENGYLELAQVFLVQNMSDSVLAIVNMGTSAGASKSDLSRITLALGNRIYSSAISTKNRDGLQKAINYLEMADRFEASSDAKFFIGHSAISIGLSAAQEALGSKSCTLAREAQQSFNKAQIYLPQAAREVKHRENSTKLLNAIPEYERWVNSMIKGFCK